MKMHIKKKIALFLVLFAIEPSSKAFFAFSEPDGEPFSSPSRGMVVISELMVNPSDELGLPPYEYIELHNTTNTTLSLHGWTLATKNTTARISDCELLPDEYLTVCGKAHLSDFSDYHPISATPWPTLPNSGAKITLRDGDGAVVDCVKYSSDFYRDKAKMLGGWSLERLDPYNLSNDAANWRASSSPLGGTPSSPNSIVSDVIDQLPPSLVSIHADESGELIFIETSEPVDLLASSIVVDGALCPVVASCLADDALDRFALALATPLDRHKVYTISSIVMEDLAGNTAQADGCRLAITEPVAEGGVVINEVMSKASLAAHDYIEIYNCSSDSYDMHDICFGPMKNGELTDAHRMTSYCRPFFPGDHIVLCNDSLEVVSHYSPLHPEWVVGSNKFGNLPAEGSFALALPDGTIIDCLDYSDKMHSLQLKDMKDVSLERILSDASTNDIANWTSASELYGYATPTQRNSQNRDNKEDIATEIEMTVKVFSPDGDGVDDEMVLSTKFGDGAWSATLKIFSSAGELVAEPYSNTPMPVTGELRWNGKSDDGSSLSPGIYIVHLSAWQTDGKTHHYKKTCTLTFTHK